ncbi:MAG: Tol-Pal system beta propeller repeat protein TolB [Candidatus Endonucleobacter bathymodioli]|uniref:Tol-Pal system protein TolB n=1 Tax=Candidatus Endonucleibacter bathymodioli TaxID=539814 RepID=A0AA90SN89_9GAMM|nr:Tol-Pal system beta propeller repeat protein TolB [Candidatus Endonucleobacter bathymodioli]
MITSHKQEHTASTISDTCTGSLPTLPADEMLPAALPSWIRWVLLLTIVSFIGLAQADLVLNVTHGNDKLTTIAVSPFGWTGNTILPEDMASIVDNDLTLSGLFEALPRNNMLSFPNTQSEVYYRDWKVLGAAYLVTGRVERALDTYKIYYQLFDIVRQKSISSGQVMGEENQLRALAHHVSDIVYEKMTGIKGDFSTRILYISAEIVTPAKKRVRRKKETIVPPVYDYSLKYADADGKRVLTIFKSREPIMSPCWSPDGSSVAYVSFETGRSSIFIQELTTGKRKQITAYKGLNSSPAWSPDGKKIAFVLSKNGSPDIYILDMPSNKLSQITSHFSIDTEPDWMPDGNSIIFTSNRGGSAQIYQLHIESRPGGLTLAKGESKRLTFHGQFNARAKVFPDGKSLAIIHKGKQSVNFNIIIQDLATGRIRRLTSSALEDSPSIAPGGRRLIYSTQGKTYGELRIVSVDGMVRYSLPSASGDVREPVWGPSINFKK